MKSLIVVALLCELVGLALSFPGDAPMPDEMDIAKAAAELHNQVLQNQLSLEAMGMPPLLLQGGSSLLDPSSGAEAQLQLATQQFQQNLAHEQFRQQEATSFSTQLDVAAERLAAERLASQQRLVSMQLQQVGVEANRALDSLAARAPVPMTSPSVAAGGARRVAFQRQAEVGPIAKQEPLALPQTVSQLWRERNPALAAVLLEPVLFGYSTLVWLVVMLLTAISSTFYFLGDKLPGRHLLPADAEAGRRQAPEPSQNGAANRLSSIFRYPGSYGSVHNRAADTPMVTRVRQDDEDEIEGVETWIKVPREPVSHQEAHYQGYVDEL
jgi:hypothetical protein